MINFYLRCDAFTVRKANLEALSKQKDSEEVTVADTMVSHCRLKFISPQLQKGKQRVNCFRGLLESITDEGVRKGLESGTLRFLRSCRINIESKDPMRCPAAIYHGVEIRTWDMHAEETSQRLRCTGDKGWYSGGARYDWVRVQIARKRDGRELPYNPLQGRLPYQMLRLFKLLVVHARGQRGETFWPAYVELTKPANGGMPERASRLLRVVKPTTAEVDAVISAGKIVGAAHVISDESATSRSQNKGSIVNSHIDLATWNDIYYMFKDELEAMVRN